MMFYRVLAAIALLLPFNSFLTLPSLAQRRPVDYYQPEQPQNNYQPNQPQNRPQPSNLFEDRVRQNSLITIPKSSAIAITFCSHVQFDAEAQQSAFPTTVYLAQPITDTEGNILAPINSLVSATVIPTEEGVQLQPEAIVIGGQYIPIKTPVVSVPVLSRNASEDGYYSSSYSNRDPEQLGIGYNVATNLRGWLGTQQNFNTTTNAASFATDLAAISGVIEPNTALLIDAGLAVVEGVFMGLNNRPPEEVKVTQVSQGVTIVFPLLGSVVVPTVAQLATQSRMYPVSQTVENPCSGGGSGFGDDQFYYQTNNGDSNYGGSGYSNYGGSGYQPANNQNFDQYD